MRIVLCLLLVAVRLSRFDSHTTGTCEAFGAAPGVPVTGPSGGLSSFGEGPSYSGRPTQVRRYCQGVDIALSVLFRGRGLTQGEGRAPYGGPGPPAGRPFHGTGPFRRTGQETAA
ncbi:hypothetical protein GCM10017667_10900 [Streptomyces filamentosus]|uniref:Uncharacterized protein n=1 Tax=Streptomyces filamentosus TaxID=67294 RepID=A0A919EIW7_STRFL|nr:hypothetical protein GCM10017667_10900 [Streptomyces filamentosus]